VDDGVATGATMMAALDAVRRADPARLIVAVGVAPQSTVTRLRDVADEVVCLEVPEPFVAVGQAFREFGPVTDEDVVRILRSEHEA
jgi:predicted phosphoribosyltransferase